MTDKPYGGAVEIPVVDEEDYDRMSGEQRRELYLTLELTVPIRLCAVTHPGGGSSSMVVFKAFCTDVYDDDETPIGMIGGGTGHVTISRWGEHGAWMIRHDDLWYAFMEAVEKHLNEDD